jgi:hypothetical protein
MFENWDGKTLIGSICLRIGICSGLL